MVAMGGAIGKRGGTTEFSPIGLMTDNSMVVVEEQLFIKDECGWNVWTELEEEEEVGGGGAGFITDGDAERGGGKEVKGSGRSTLPASKAARSTSIVI